jgi:hypothetical protein
VNTIIEELKSATKDAGFKDLSFANLQEFNSFMDSFNFLDYPRNIIVPYNLNGTLKNNRKKKVIPLQGWALLRIKEDTNDYRSVKLEADYIQPMRVLVEKFLVQIANSDLTDSEVEDISYSIKPEYMFLSAHLFGVSYSINWPIRANIC